MFVTLDQAIEIHAKVLAFRSGKNAVSKAKDTALFCEKRGDKEGFDVWMKVAEKIVDLKQAANSALGNRQNTML